jgi:hypothetical protein
MRYSQSQCHQHGGCPRQELVGSASSTAHNMTLSLRPLQPVPEIHHLHPCFNQLFFILIPQRGSAIAIGCITFSAT